MEKGESEGKTLVDAMLDGSLDGMQPFDMVIENMIREGVLDPEVGLGYATNPGNLRLQLADFLAELASAQRGAKIAGKPGGTELEIER